MSFVHLHAHTTYSFLDGYGSTTQVVERLKVLGHTSCAITDHGNTFGHVDYEKTLTHAGIKPIHGTEFYIVDDMTEKTSKYIPSLGVNANPHVTVIAMNQKGYSNLVQLNTLAWREGFYYKPRIDWCTLAKYQEGLCVLSGCVGGFPSQLILEKDSTAAYDFISARRNEIEHYYVELIPEPGLDISHSTFPVLLDIAKDLGIPCVMTADAHFPRPEDHIIQDTMLCIGLRTTLNDTQRTIKLPEYQYYCTEQELLIRAREMMRGHEKPDTEQELLDALENAGTIADMCNAEIPKAKPILYPGIDRANGATAADTLWAWIEEGIEYRIAQKKLPTALVQQYRDRATREFAVLRDKNFCDYILAVTDLCRWAKQRDTLVMCRGSAGGCLLLWLLGASETDSIFLDLDFDRFMDVTRNDPPDIDIDFETSMKEEVYQYLSSKYGADKVCQIMALSTIRARVAVQDIAAVHSIPREQYQPLSVALDSKDDDVDRQLAALTDEAALAVLEKYPIFRMIDGLVGQIRQSTIHAAGVLISSEPLHNSISIINQPGKPRVSSVDKYSAAHLGYLKLDLLMVSAYDVLADAVRRIGANMAWLYSLPYDDPAVYRMAQEGRVAGVFQLDGAALRIGHEIKLDKFDELIAASALCRPGALEHVPTYKRNKFDTKYFSNYLNSIHPLAHNSIKDTYGILLYQEQVMRICHQMGGMPMNRVHQLRKKIGSSAVLSADYGEEFISGAIHNGVTEEEARYWWQVIKHHGLYSFNKSHAATYAIVGYWMLYMKVHYPEAYYESYLKHEGASGNLNELLMKRLIRDYRFHGGKIKLLDPQTSKMSFFSPESGTIVGGYGNITGIGKATALAIVKNAPYRDWEDLRTRSAMPMAMYYKLHEAGITGALPFDQQAVTELASWLPIAHTGTEESEYRKQSHFPLLQDISHGESIDGDVVVTGYVTAIQKLGSTGVFKGQRTIYVLEDETGSIEFRCSSKQNALSIKLKDSVGKGDYIALCGWWAGEQLFVKDFSLLKRRK